MRGLVIVHEGDRVQAEGLANSGAALSTEIFGIEHSKFDFCRFYIDRDNRPVLELEDETKIDPQRIGQRWSVVILIAGNRAVTDSRLTAILRDFLSGDWSPDWSNETLIVIPVIHMTNSPLLTLAPRRVFFTPDRSKAATLEFASAEWKNQVQSEFDGLVRMIDENQTRNPNVGFGLLLVDNKCNCFLMERLRDPGRGQFGTIGGNFERGHDIVSELTTVLRRRFRRNGGPEVDLGPLLACTNMKNEFLHYIDLTFLALIKGGSVSDVLDDELRPLGSAALQLLPRSDAHGTRLMFTLPELGVFHKERMLFTPVANAFEALCRSIFNEQLHYGRRRRIRFPSLIDEGRTLELQLPEDPDCMRQIVTAMPWSKSALPFFEGEIS
jgi:hypothetical protein